MQMYVSLYDWLVDEITLQEEWKGLLEKSINTEQF